MFIQINFFNFTYLELVLACALFLLEKNLFMTQRVIANFNMRRLSKIEKNKYRKGMNKPPTNDPPLKIL